MKVKKDIIIVLLAFISIMLMCILFALISINENIRDAIYYIKLIEHNGHIILR